MFEWDQSDVICEIEIDHEGMPTPGDIYIDCGEDIYDTWVEQQPCMELRWQIMQGILCCTGRQRSRAKRYFHQLAAAHCASDPGKLQPGLHIIDKYL